MSRDSTTAAVSSTPAARKEELTHRAAVLVILAMAVVADQVAKGWAWRHAPGARINFGGNAFVGDTVSAWYADPVTGALLDFAGFGLLSAAVIVLLRRRLPVMILISGALMTGGWLSNLFDRLGMHYWTAPGSVRGAVDFIPLGWLHYNVADVFIACGTLLFIVAMGALVLNRSATARSWAPMPPGRRRSRMWMLGLTVAVCLTGVVGFGAVNYGGVTAPRQPSTRPLPCQAGAQQDALVRLSPWERSHGYLRYAERTPHCR